MRAATRASRVSAEDDRGEAGRCPDSIGWHTCRAALEGAAERGYKGVIYQTHGIATDDFIKLGGKDVEGTMFAGEAYTIADDLDANDPFKKVTEADIAAYRASQNQRPVIFGAHIFDSMQLVAKAVPEAQKVAKSGSSGISFRVARRHREIQGHLPEQRPPSQYERNRPQRL